MSEHQALVELEEVGSQLITPMSIETRLALMEAQMRMLAKQHNEVLLHMSATTEKLNNIYSVFRHANAVLSAIKWLGGLVIAIVALLTVIDKLRTLK